MHSNTSRILELFCHKLKKLITHFIQMISLKLLVQLSVIVSGVRGVLHAGLSTSDPIDLASQFSTEFLISSLSKSLKHLNHCDSFLTSLALYDLK
ncbi:hypothetical protein Tco_0992920 [Tanacetum coccineum]|uniref:Uncharacterized protein n=1 Tax=Tanacetum coccineum TaxID=301880 RepID=A0ABQ5F3G8_9ASTR